MAAEREPWARLEKTVVAHLESILAASAYARVVIRILPSDAPEIAAELKELRDRYEARLNRCFSAIPLPRERDLLSPRFCCISAPVPIWLRGSGLDFLLARRTSRTDNSRRVRRHPPMTIGRKLASARRDGVSNFARPVRLRRAGRAVEFASPPGGRCATRGVERERRRRMEFRRRA